MSIEYVMFYFDPPIEENIATLISHTYIYIYQIYVSGCRMFNKKSTYVGSLQRFIEKRKKWMKFCVRIFDCRNHIRTDNYRIQSNYYNWKWLVPLGSLFFSLQNGHTKLQSYEDSTRLFYFIQFQKVGVRLTYIFWE